MNGESFLKEIGRSYIVSAFLPSALFVSLGYLIFRGFIPSKFADQLKINNPVDWGEWVFLFVLVTWVAFYLFSAKNITVRIFEGYSLPSWLKIKMRDSIIRRRGRDFAINYQRYIDFSPELEGLTEEMVEQLETEGKELWSRAFQELQRIELKGPLEEENVLPTRLANVLRASEIYALERYWIEGITVWPRLTPILPSKLANTIEERNNHLMFMLNSAFLIYVNAILCLFFGLAWLPCYLFSDLGICQRLSKYAGFFHVGYDYISPLTLLLLGGFLIGFGYILYCVGVDAAEGLGLYVRSGYDLYRMNLLKQLNQKLPESLDEERDIWLDVSTFFVAAGRLGKIRNDSYVYYDQFYKAEEINNEKKAEENQES